MTRAVAPKRWQVVDRVLTSRRYRVELFWNASAGCFTGRVLDQAGRFAPAEREGTVWAATGPTAVEALDALAAVIASAQVAVSRWTEP